MYTSAPMSEVPTISFADDTCMFATWRSVEMPVFGHRGVGLESARMLGRLIESHGRSTGKGKLLEITYLDPDAPMPSAEVREALDAMVPRVSPYYGSVAAIYEGEGFKSAMVRGLLTSFQLLSRAKYPQKTFGDLTECAHWSYRNGVELGMVAKDAKEFADAIRFVQAEGIRRGILSKR